MRSCFPECSWSLRTFVNVWALKSQIFMSIFAVWVCLYLSLFRGLSNNSKGTKCCDLSLWSLQHFHMRGFSKPRNTTTLVNSWIHRLGRLGEDKRRIPWVIRQSLSFSFLCSPQSEVVFLHEGVFILSLELWVGWHRHSCGYHSCHHVESHLKPMAFQTSIVLEFTQGLRPPLSGCHRYLLKA